MWAWNFPSPHEHSSWSEKTQKLQIGKHEAKWSADIRPFHNSTKGKKGPKPPNRSFNANICECLILWNILEYYFIREQTAFVTTLSAVMFMSVHECFIRSIVAILSSCFNCYVTPGVNKQKIISKLRLISLKIWMSSFWHMKSNTVMTVILLIAAPYSIKTALFWFFFLIIIKTFQLKKILSIMPLSMKYQGVSWSCEFFYAASVVRFYFRNQIPFAN